MYALILVDIQNDFMPGGALGVPHGDEILPLVNHLQELFNLIIATKDWHPTMHLSFASSHPNKQPGEIVQNGGLDQILWPAHCVQGTFGADFVSELQQNRWSRVFLKGTSRSIDSYSGFYDNGNRRATGLENYLHSKRIRTVYIVGLATDYCVKHTALDAVHLGFNTFVVTDACRGVNLNPEDVVIALRDMENAGVKLVESHELIEKYSAYGQLS